MKDFITAIASVIVIMMFVMQFSANEAALIKVMGAEHAIREMRLISENQGMIKSENIAELKDSLAAILHCTVSEIDVNLRGAEPDNSNDTDKTESIRVEVTMPLYDVIGPSGILGISPSENIRMYRSSGKVVLEPKSQEPEEYIP
ncbi:MAG: hypothetical protein IKW01_02720 [Firmicutes bacterium]|nr:hypothetical protein [Bacillota bacterium]